MESETPRIISLSPLRIIRELILGLHHEVDPHTYYCHSGIVTVKKSKAKLGMLRIICFSLVFMFIL